MNENKKLRQSALGINELQGCVPLGMKREALKLARRTLKQAEITKKDFGDALNAILVHANKCKPWSPVLAQFKRVSQSFL
jgi:hypothetical protein